MSPNEINTVIILSIAAVLVYLGVSHDRSSKKMKEDNVADLDQKNSSKISEENGYINRLDEFSDAREKIDHLVQRYSWRALLSLVGINGDDITLLHMIGEGGGHVELPNPNTKHPTILEDFELTQARKIMRGDQENYGNALSVADYFQGVSTVNLSSLRALKLVEVSPSIDNETRNFFVTLTVTGMSLIALDELFSSKYADRLQTSYLNQDETVKRRLTELVRGLLFDSSNL